MKKIISVVLAILVMVTSCVCSFTSFASDCSDGHTFLENSIASINDSCHRSTCVSCGEIVVEDHNLYIDTSEGAYSEATCESAGLTTYRCSECNYVKEVVETKKAHEYVITKFEYTVVEGIAKFKRTDICCNSCENDVIEGNAGSTNTCPKCTQRMLYEKTIYYPNCAREGYTEYKCYNCGTYKSDEKAKTDHKFVATVIPATCTDPGKTREVCNCSRFDLDKDDDDVIHDTVREGHYIPAKGHRLEKAGETYKYKYESGKCKIWGKCADCNFVYTEENPFEKLNVVPDQCPDCGFEITYKSITMPTDCTQGAVIEYTCPKNNNIITVTALPLGHVAKTTTYNYVNGEYKDTIIDCYRCGYKVVQSETYNKDIDCAIPNCNGKIVKRVEVAPTCDDNGRTIATCSLCGDYTESVVTPNGHSAKVSEWTFDFASNTYTVISSCNNYGCNGYEKQGNIGILGKCVKCKEDGTLLYKKVTSYDCMSKEQIDYQCTNCCPTVEVEETNELVVKTMSMVEGGTKRHNTITADESATCTTDGGTKTTCINCYYTTVKNEVKALGHSLNVGVIDYDGHRIYGYCERCKKDINEPYEKTKECLMPNCDGYVLKEVIEKPNCSINHNTNGYTRVYCSKGCTNYDYEGYYIPDSSIIKATHSYGEWTILKQATCSETGIQERICANCGGKQTVDIPANTTESGDPKHVFFVMERGYPATCTTEGLSDWVYCSQCNLTKKAEVIPATGHLLDPNSTNKNFCSRCNSYIIGEDSNQVVCSCMCHNEDGLAKFFFKIIMFFCNILGINQKCECGRSHMN